MWSFVKYFYGNNCTVAYLYLFTWEADNDCVNCVLWPPISDESNCFSSWTESVIMSSNKQNAGEVYYL